MLFHPTKVLLTVFSILFKIQWTCCVWMSPILENRTSTKLRSSKNQEPHQSNLKAVFRDLSQSAIPNYTALCCSLIFSIFAHFSFLSLHIDTF